MAQIRAKQIKLVAADDLLVGGTGGNGGVLTKGGNNSVLRMSGAGVLGYGNVDTASVNLTTDALMVGVSGVGSALSKGANDSVLRVAHDGTLGYGNVASGSVSLAQNKILLGDSSGNASEVTMGAGKSIFRVAADGLSVGYGNIEKDAINLASGSLLLGASGVGSALAATNAGDVVQVVGGTFVSAPLDSSNIVFATTETGVRALSSTSVIGAINELGDNRTFSKSATVDPGANDDALAGFAIGDVWMNTSNGRVFVAQAVTSAHAVWTRIDNGAGTNLFTYKGGFDASTEAHLPAGAAEGDYYRITGTGTVDGLLLKSGDGMVFNGTTFDRIDNAESTVLGTADKITVTASGTGNDTYTVTIASTYAGQASIVTVGTITTGTWNGAPVDQAHGGVGTMFTNATKGDIMMATSNGVMGTLTIGSQYQILSVNGSAQLVYGYSSDLRDSTGAKVVDAASGTLTLTTGLAGTEADNAVANKKYVDDAKTAAESFATSAANTAESNAKAYADTVSGQALTDAKAYTDTAINGHSITFTVEEFAGVSGGNQKVTVTKTPLNGIVNVFINGLRLKSNMFALSGKDVTLNDTNVGYSTDSSDVIEVEYAYNPTV